MWATPMTDLSRWGHSALFTDVNGCWCLDLVAHEAALAANTFAVNASDCRLLQRRSDGYVGFMSFQ